MKNVYIASLAESLTGRSKMYILNFDLSKVNNYSRRHKKWPVTYATLAVNFRQWLS